MKVSEADLKKLIVESVVMSEGLRYHLRHSRPIYDCIYRIGSKAYFELICESRKMYRLGYLDLCEEDIELVNTDIGEFGMFEGRKVALDLPVEQEIDELFEAEYRGRKVTLNKPKRGGKKKFYVYVRDPDTKNTKKVAFGAKGMTTGLRDPERSKSFERRHKCKEKKDKTKPGWWACRIGRYPKVTGAPYRRWW